MTRTIPRIALASLVLLAASVDCMAQSRLLFNRGATYGDGTLRYSNIFRINADGTDMRQLTPTVDDTYNGGAAWSPHGTYVAYSFRTRVVSRSDIYLMTSTGAGKRRVTSGTGEYVRPMWRPDGGRIAFTARYSTRQCVATVRPDGVDQRDVFCVASPTWIDNAAWSRDGTRLFVSTGMRGSGLEPPHYSRAYRVNPGTGAATLLTAQVLEEERSLFFSSDGSRGLYASSWEEGPIDTVDFASDAITPLAHGFAPVYSNSGARIAFSATQVGDGPDFNRYTNIFVINADGSGERQVTHTITNDVEYTTAQWSRYNTHLLVDRTQYEPESPGSGTYVGTSRMRIINVATGTGNWLPQGGAADWHQEP